MLSFFLAAFVHLAILSGGMGILHSAAPAAATPPSHHGHMHTMDSGWRATGHLVVLSSY